MHRVYETLTPEQRSQRARTAAKAAHQPEVLAARIVKGWPALSPQQQHTVRALLRPVTKGQIGRVD